ncbi:MAG: VanZ family protein [Nostocaceae cyanobacterium]|nr:VanZ family protein [Nostocaceae cyanobacterium]
MNKRQIHHLKKPSNKNHFFINTLLVLVSISVILLATLYPFNFVFIDSLSLAELIASFGNTSFFQDQVNNILLFIPLGFGLTSLLQKVKIKVITKIIIIIVVSAGLSITVEILQVFLPSRIPTPADILNNTIGGFVGWLSFNLYNSENFSYTLTKLENSRASQSIKRMMIFFIGYILLTFIILFGWQSTTNLSHWNPNYPLLLGNELTGNRPWQGYIYQLYIADQAITNNQVSRILADTSYFKNLGDSLLGVYDFNDKYNYQEKDSKLPKLLWQEKAINSHNNKGVYLNNYQWLKTSEPATFINQRISKTSEFTISTTVATANTDQNGPARIISISKDSLRRNFTLGQEGTALDLRLRTPLTGENGSELKLKIPGIFVDTKPHHIIITYSQGTLQVYIDNVHRAYCLNLWELIPIQQKIFYYALSFMPLGICLTLLTIMAKRKQITQKILFWSGILLPSLILEAILISENGKNLSWKDLLLGILFTAVTTLILKLRADILRNNVISNQ